jgi:hypothetical protein
MIREAREICKSSVHGAVEKVESDSSEKRLHWKTGGRRIASASNMKKRCALAGRLVNGVSIHAERLGIV